MIFRSRRNSLMLDRLCTFSAWWNFGSMFCSPFILRFLALMFDRAELYSDESNTVWLQGFLHSVFSCLLSSNGDATQKWRHYGRTGRSWFSDCSPERIACQLILSMLTLFSRTAQELDVKLVVDNNLNIHMNINKTFVCIVLFHH